MVGLCCCTQAFFSCGERELLFIVVHKLLIAVVSLVLKERLLVHRPQWLWLTGLVTLRHVESSQTRDWTSVPCIARQILSHWTAREALTLCILFILCFYHLLYTYTNTSITHIHYACWFYRSSWLLTGVKVLEFVWSCFSPVRFLLPVRWGRQAGHMKRFAQGFHNKEESGFQTQVCSVPIQCSFCHQKPSRWFYPNQILRPHPRPTELKSRGGNWMSSSCHGLNS